VRAYHFFLARLRAVDIALISLPCAPVDVSWGAGTCSGGIDSPRMQQAVQFLHEYAPRETLAAFLARAGWVEQVRAMHKPGRKRDGAPQVLGLECMRGERPRRPWGSNTKRASW